jgi:hypothetical protein
MVSQLGHGDRSCALWWTEPWYDSVKALNFKPIKPTKLPSKKTFLSNKRTDTGTATSHLFGTRMHVRAFHVVQKP